MTQVNRPTRGRGADLVAIEARFWPKVAITPGCWLWQGTRTSGYGSFYARRPDGTTWTRAHRIAYELLVGPIPDGLTLDHLCRVRHCINPDHLEPVTIAENLRRAQALITHCPSGHPYSVENTAWWRNKRQCRTCHRERQRARR